MDEAVWRPKEILYKPDDSAAFPLHPVEAESHTEQRTNPTLRQPSTELKANLLVLLTKATRLVKYSCPAKGQLPTLALLYRGRCPS